MLIPVGIDRPLVRVPYATMTIAVVNLLVHMVNEFVEFPFDFSVAFGFVPGHHNNSILTLFSHMFVHSDWGHLIGNLIFFSAAGIKLEDALGPLKFILFYIGCGILANFVFVVVSSANAPIPLVGASGAIAGVIGGFVLLYPFSKVRVIIPIRVAFHGVPSFFLPALLYFGFWILKEVLYLAADLSSKTVGGGVAFAAHVGGFLAGALWAWAFVGWNQGDNVDDKNLTRYTAPRLRAH